MEFPEAVGWLEALGRSRAEPGLTRVARLLERLGEPHRALSGALVAGTNGKGSTCAFMSAAVRAAGLRVGSMPSPHLQHYGERIQVDGAPMSEQAFARLCTRVRPEVERLARTGVLPTMFEVLTAAAFLHFAESRIDLVVIEAGMGGLDDATNVLDLPVKVITNVALDHQDFLGPDIHSIAANKAGIIRAGNTVLTGPLVSSAAAAVAQRVDALVDVRSVSTADCTQVDRHPSGRVTVRLSENAAGLRPRALHDLHVPLAGAHQVDNLALAVLAVAALERAYGMPEIRPDQWRKGLANVSLPGRLEKVGVVVGGLARTVLLDGAHNPHAMSAVLDHLRGVASRGAHLTLVFGAMADKDVVAMVSMIPEEWRVIFTTSGEARSAEPASMAALRASPLEVAPDVGTALRQAFAASDDGQVVVLGSLHVVGAARTALAAVSAERVQTSEGLPS